MPKSDYMYDFTKKQVRKIHISNDEKFKRCFQNRSERRKFDKLSEAKQAIILQSLRDAMEKKPEYYTCGEDCGGGSTGYSKTVKGCVSRRSFSTELVCSRESSNCMLATYDANLGMYRCRKEKKAKDGTQ